jgi:geranylgeranylglycerol-phosphate geranylgeranyltransferase
MTPRPSALVTRPGPPALLRGLFFIIHPFPALMNALAGAVFYLMVAHAVRPLSVASMFFSVLLIHASIGSMNDVCDVVLDTETKPDKPIVRGDISPRGALLVSGLAAIAGALLSLSFNGATLCVALAVLAAGMAYNFWAKGTAWSWVPYGVFIPALPVWAFVAAGAFMPVVLFSFPLGALMSLALNVANTVPDLEGDRQCGLQGIAHRLGLRRSLLVVWSCFGATIILLALTPSVLGNNPATLLPGLLAGSALLLVMILDRIFSRSAASLRRGWNLSAAIAAILGTAWVASLATG